MKNIARRTTQLSERAAAMGHGHTTRNDLKEGEGAVAEGVDQPSGGEADEDLRTVERTTRQRGVEIRVQLQSGDANGWKRGAWG